MDAYLTKTQQITREISGEVSLDVHYAALRNCNTNQPGTKIHFTLYVYICQKRNHISLRLGHNFPIIEEKKLDTIGKIWAGKRLD